MSIRPLSQNSTQSAVCSAKELHSRAHPAERPRFRWTCYGAQLVGAWSFFSMGLWLTARHFLWGARMSRHEASEELAALFRKNLEHYVRWGCLRLDSGDLLPLAKEKGLILAANHPSLFDAVAILGALPQTTCVMRAALMGNLTMRGGALNCGFIPNDSGADFVRLSVERLQEGSHLLIFPEGTRTAPGELLGDFKGGFALVAVKARRPVQTILIEHEGQHLAKGGAVLAPGSYPVTLRFRLGERFYPGEGERPRALLERVRQYFWREVQAGLQA